MEKRESSLCICPPAETKVHAEIWFEVFVTRFGWSPRKRFKPRSLPSAPNPSCLVLSCEFERGARISILERLGCLGRDYWLPRVRVCTRWRLLVLCTPVLWCRAGQGGNQGCGILAQQPNTYGAGFNAAVRTTVCRPPR